MENKYLPIGSICTLKGKNKKVMITGYYSVEFNGNLKIKDYVGCVYPEGLLLPSQIITFNHTDIETINFIGFKNEEYSKFLNLLNRLTGNISEEEQAKEFHKKNDMFLASNSTYSKLLFDENGVVMIADPVEKEEKTRESIFKDIKFDENGTVISVDNNADISNPFYREYENISNNSNEEQSSNWNIFKNIKFDENGTVISAENIDDSKKESMLSNIQFDENGTVISVGKEELEQEVSKRKYHFDENGVLISIDEEIDYRDIPAIGPGLPGYEQLEQKKEGNYKFDENGILVSE